MENTTIERRVIKNVNNSYESQVRFLPVADYEPNDGWRTVFISSIKEFAEKDAGVKYKED